MKEFGNMPRGSRHLIITIIVVVIVVSIINYYSYDYSGIEASNDYIYYGFWDQHL